MSYANAWFATNFPYYEKNNPQLYDVLFQYLTPPITRNYPDVLILGLTIYFVVKYLYKNTIIASKFFFLLGTLYAFRVLIFTLTETPEPKRYQKTCSNKTTFSLANVKWFALGTGRSCIDHMFSGHALFGVSIMMFILTLSKNNLEKIVVSIATASLLIALVWSRLHYTQDVLIALFMTIAWSKIILGCTYFD